MSECRSLELPQRFRVISYLTANSCDQKQKTLVFKTIVRVPDCLANYLP